jgi:succinyl-CoA synthetase beta subunit
MDKETQAEMFNFFLLVCRCRWPAKPPGRRFCLFKNIEASFASPTPDHLPPDLLPRPAASPQGAQLMSQYGINVPPGIPVRSLDDLPAALQKMADAEGKVVLKSQILAGGRGLGSFTNGLKGGVHIASVTDAPALAAKMLGGTLVTKQTGSKGKPVGTLYVANKMSFAREMYFAILLDRQTAGPVMIGCSEGGTSIEDLAEKFPDKIIKIPVDIRQGITDEQALKVGCVSLFSVGF